MLPKRIETGTENSDTAERGTFDVPATMNLQATVRLENLTRSSAFSSKHNLLNHKLYRQP